MGLKDILYAILAILLLIAVAWCGYRVVQYGDVKQERDDLKSRVDTLEQNDARYDKALTDKAARDNTARQGRQAIESNLDRNARNDPTTAAYLDSTIPDGVRNAFTDPAPSGRAAGADDRGRSLPDVEGRHGGPAVYDAGRVTTRAGGG
jgi:hypothetical protein